MLKKQAQSTSEYQEFKKSSRLISFCRDLIGISCTRAQVYIAKWQAEFHCVIPQKNLCAMLIHEQEVRSFRNVIAHEGEAPRSIALQQHQSK